MGPPELVAVTCSLKGAHHLLGELVDQVRSGVRLDAPGADTVQTSHGPYPRRFCHPAHDAAGLFAAWHGYYRGIGRLDLSVTALQVVVPELVCDGCSPYDLARPTPLLSGAHPTG